MHKSFFHLQSDPFNNSPDPRFLLMTPHAREALAALRYGISARKGFMVITGEPGTGKTTLLRYALSLLDPSRVLPAYVFNPRLEVLDFLEFVLNDFGVTPTYRTKSSMLLQFNRWLVERYKEGKTCVVVVDEAQHLSWELLEEVRLLTNLETSNEKLLQIVLSGQPEFEEKLRQIDARQLRQRITLSCRTLPLTADQIGPYVEHRIKTAAAPDPQTEESRLPVFSPEVLKLIHSASRGIPRVVNLICEHTLIYSYVDSQHQISEETVQGVLTDLELDGAPLFPPQVPPATSVSPAPPPAISNATPDVSKASLPTDNNGKQAPTVGEAPTLKQATSPPPAKPSEQLQPVSATGSTERKTQ